MFRHAASYFGDPEAQYQVGRMYLEGTGTPKDAVQAARWLRLAADMGQRNAQALLGAMLFKGTDVSRQAAMGLFWLTVAKDAVAKEGGGPDDKWITDTYASAFAQATEDERVLAHSYLEGWMRAAALTLACAPLIAPLFHLDREIDDHRHVVGRLFPSTDMPIDGRADEPVGGLRRQQDMVDADAVVLLPGAGLIVPEGVEVGAVAAGAHRVGQPEIDERPKSFPGLRQEQRVAYPGGRIAGIGRRSESHCSRPPGQRLLQRQAFARIVNKPVHPFDLVWIFVGVRRVAIGQIDRGDPHHAVLRRDDRLQEAGLLVAIVARQPGVDLVEREPSTGSRPR